jgi:ABC-type sugar transport system permease subunit
VLTVSRARADQVARLFVGSLLLLPALLAFGLVFWLPALRTLGLSLQSAVPGRPGTFAGLSNYTYPWREPGFWPALTCSVQVALVRVVAVMPLPLLLGWSWGCQGRHLRLLGRLVLSLGLALSTPAALSLLWRLALLRLPLLQLLAPAGGAQSPAAYLLLEFVAFLGTGGALTAMALLLARPRQALTARGILGLGAIAALSSGLNSFSLPFALGSDGRTAPLAVRVFRTAFAQLRLGQGAAEAVPLLALSVGLGLCFGLISERIGLRLVVARAEEARPLSWPALLLGAVGLALLVSPLTLLYLWGAGMAFLYPGEPLARAASSLDLAVALLNGNLAPVAAIVCVQLPAAYLAAVSLALVRPFGRRGSSVAFAGLLASGFVPPLVVGIGLFDWVRRAGLFNTVPASGLPLVAGPASFYLLKLYFTGQEARLAHAIRGGLAPVSAFFRHLFRPSLPVALLAGALSFLLAGQSLLWPLLVLARRDLYPLALHLLVHQSQFTGEPALLAAGAWLVLTCWGAGMLAIWWPLQTLVLERLEVVAGVRRNL